MPQKVHCFLVLVCLTKRILNYTNFCVHKRANSIILPLSWKINIFPFFFHYHLIFLLNLCKAIAYRSYSYNRKYKWSYNSDKPKQLFRSELQAYAYSRLICITDKSLLKSSGCPINPSESVTRPSTQQSLRDRRLMQGGDFKWWAQFHSLWRFIVQVLASCDNMISQIS